MGRARERRFSDGVMLLLMCVCLLACGAILVRTCPGRDISRLSPAVRASGSDAGPAVLLSLSPWRVGIQVGHWKLEELPTELWRVRTDTGAREGALREVDLNLAIAQRVVDDLREAGVTVDLLGAAVPAGYDADAFIAIHADGGSPRQGGWKAATPWFASEASGILRDCLARAYGALTDLPEDRYGVTRNMRGYYAFNWTRFSRAVTPWTPAAIIETGCLGSARDRVLLADHPDRAASAISMGIIMFLARRAGLSAASFAPRSFPPRCVSSLSATLRFFPGEREPAIARLPAGTRVHPLDERDGWVELIVGGNDRLFGWTRAEALSAEAPVAR
jgi:N-acetylmuramoyl-L-alanine amidase